MRVLADAGEVVGEELDRYAEQHQMLRNWEDNLYLLRGAADSARQALDAVGPLPPTMTVRAILDRLLAVVDDTLARSEVLPLELPDPSEIRRHHEAETGYPLRPNG